MESILNLNQSERVRINFNLVIGLFLLSVFAIIFLGVNGLLLSILALLGFIITPFIYNKPGLFLIFTLLIYPFTRIFPLDDKFIITGTLYTLSIPCGFWLICKTFRKISIDSYYLWAMALYAVIILLNFLRPETGIISLGKEFGRMFMAVFMILAVYNYVENSPDNLKKITRYLSYMFNLMALISLLQLITHKGGWVIEGFYRVRGTFYNFNEYGYAISLFICFALYILLTSNNSKTRFYWSSTIFLNLVVLMATFSKTSIINVGLIFLIMSLFLPFKRRIQLFGGLIVFGTGLMSFLVLSGNLDTLILRFSNTKSLLWRFDIWRTLYSLIHQGNMLLGQGINASREFLELIVPAGTSNAPHNVYLETWYNFGLVGLVPFVMIFILLLFKGISIFFEEGIIDNQNKIIGISVIVISLITMIQNFVSNAFYDRAANIFFWVIITLLICWYNHYKSDSKLKGSKYEWSHC